MSYGLYKAGQGYWVRVLAASMAGIIVMAACAWCWTQLEIVSGHIPKARATLTLAAPLTGTATPGQTIALLGDPTESGGRPQIGTARVKQTDPTSTRGVTLVIEKLDTPKHDITAVRAVGPVEGGATLSGVMTGNVQTEDLFPPLYLQGAGVGLMMIAGTALTWWLVGVRQPTVEFLIATDGEMKKVNWSTRRDVTASTWVVVMWSVLLATGLFGVDFLFSQFFRLIGVLQQG